MKSPMMPRPVYRWKSFWLGVLVLVFLGWGMMRSRGWTESLWWNYNADGDFAVLWHGLGRCGFSTGSDSFSFDGAAGIDFHSEEKLRSPFSGPEALMLGLDESIHWECAIWMVVLMFFIVWCGWLMWRWRRMRRAGLDGEAGG